MNLLRQRVNHLAINVDQKQPIRKKHVKMIKNNMLFWKPQYFIQQNSQTKPNPGLLNRYDKIIV
jgi:hypothetical protein